MIQTGEIRDFPVVLVGPDYWAAGLLRWLRERPSETGQIASGDLGLVQTTADVAEVRTLVERGYALQTRATTAPS